MTQVITATSTEYGAPPGYCQTGTVTRTSVVTRTNAISRTITQTSTVTSTEAGQPPGYCTNTVTRTVTRTTTRACTPTSRPPVSNCRAPVGRFNIVIQNFGAAYLTSTSGGRTPNADHETLSFTSDSSQALVFGAVSNGQTTIVTTGSQTLFSDQSSDSSGNGPIYFDSIDTIQGYGTEVNAVQFCLQDDNSFLVQNAEDGATDVMMCAGVIYLYTAANAATSGCTPVTLVKA